MHGGVSPAAYHIRNSPGTSFSPSNFGNSSPMTGLVALSPARTAPLYIGGGSVSPGYPFPSQSETVMGPPAPTKVKKHKKKKHKKKKPGSILTLLLISLLDILKASFLASLRICHHVDP